VSLSSVREAWRLTAGGRCEALKLNFGAYHRPRSLSSNFLHVIIFYGLSLVSVTDEVPRVGLGEVTKLSSSAYKLKLTS
jgi:hypothetical protein